MSFSSDVKTDLISNSDNNACCNLAELSGMLDKLKKPASFLEKLSGKYTGVFEVYRWSGCEVFER